MRAQDTWRPSVVGIAALAGALSCGCGVAPEKMVGLLDGPVRSREAPRLAPGRSRYEQIMAMGLSDADLAAARKLWPEVFGDEPRTVAYSGPDLWDRIRAGFALPAVQRPEVQAQVGWFARNPGYLVGTSRRAQPYLYHIVEQVEARGMPSEIALLPVILAFASQATGLSVAALSHLNPGLSGALAGGEGGGHIVLPIDRADAFRARLRSG